MSGTLSHSQSQFVTRAELLTIPPPVGTATWKPIAHGDLIQAIDRQLLVRGIQIQQERFAIQREGARLFGVLDLAFEDTAEFCAAMGIRIFEAFAQEILPLRFFPWVTAAYFKPHPELMTDCQPRPSRPPRSSDGSSGFAPGPTEDLPEETDAGDP